MDLNKTFARLLAELVKHGKLDKNDVEAIDIASFLQVYFANEMHQWEFPMKQFAINTQTDYDIDWSKLAIELIKHGYSVNLYQNQKKLVCRRAWVYPK